MAGHQSLRHGDLSLDATCLANFEEVSGADGPLEGAVDAYATLKGQVALIGGTGAEESSELQAHEACRMRWMSRSSSSASL